MFLNYRALRNSNIDAYEILDGVIKVRFNDGSVYTYEEKIIGRDKYNIMCTLAKRGEGLNSFINKNVRDLYSDKSK